jgi:signal transduction histidine kinase/ActR/RegA family two-component response regulator
VLSVYRDGFSRVLLLAALLLWLPYFLPDSPLAPALDPAADKISGMAYFLQGVMLLLGMAGCLSSWSRRSQEERRFFGLIALGLAAWGVEQAVEYQIKAQWEQDLRISLLGDSLYVLLYLCLILALELRPHARTRGAAGSRLRWLDLGGAAVMTLGLFAYVVLPVFAYDVETYLGYVPSDGLYSLFDLYLVTRLASLVISTGHPRWRATYGWMLAGASIWLVFDLSETLELLGVVTRPFSHRVFDTSWFLTPLLFAMAARARREIAPDVAAGSEDEGDFFAELWGGPLLANAVLFPLVHLVVSASSKALPEVQSVRELVAGVATLSLLGMAVVAQRLLAQENRRLESEREAVHGRALMAQRLENLGKLAGGVAHDFNNLLQVIRVCADGLLAELEPRSGQRVYAQEILLATERAAALGGRLLSLAREEPARPATFELNGAVARSVQMMRRIMGEGIELQSTLDERAGTVFADRAQLELVLLNLGVNAREALPRGGLIQLETGLVQRDGRDWSTLVVRDNGLGMDAATKARVFEPFFTTKRDGRGTGLGLTLVKSFVDTAGGKIEVESAPACGTTFRITLPRSSGAKSEPIHVAPGARLTGSATVLVVEDERAVRSVIAGFLQEGGFRVLEAASGREALQLLAKTGMRPDLLMTDLVMPDMGGAALAELVVTAHPGLPVIYMTGYAGQKLDRKAPAGALLEKPFALEELDRALRAALNRASAGGAPAEPRSDQRATDGSSTSV